MAVSRRLRFEVLKRDNHACRYCGETAPTVKLTVDHVVPVALGGADDPSNLVTACQPCNAGKSSVSPDAPTVAEVSFDTLLMAEAIRMVMDDRHHEHMLAMATLELFDEAWRDWTWGSEKKPVPRDDNWRSSVVRFYELGYTAEQLIWFVRVAMESKAKVVGKWTYFCGCVWNDLSRVQAEAMARVEARKKAVA